jgi:hypothetical protein
MPFQDELIHYQIVDTSFIATFLLTYRSFCTTKEFITLLETRYNVKPPKGVTPDELEVWTERKQKLIRLRFVYSPCKKKKKKKDIFNK